MHALLSILARHGYALIFGLLLAEAVGFPFPAAIALVAAGAGIASHTLWGTGVLLAAMVGLMIGDSASSGWGAIRVGRCLASFAVSP